jgi:hypothetical protein
LVGQLTDPDRLLVDANVERLRLRLFDYEVRNAGNIRLAFDRNTIRLGGADPNDPDRRATFEGVEAGGRPPRLELGGTIDLSSRRIDARTIGEANLGILQGFFPAPSAAGASCASPATSGARSRSRPSPGPHQSPTGASATSRCHTRSRR